MNASNTKREIKALITQLQRIIKGLITWGKQVGRVSPTTTSRGIQVEQITKDKPVTVDAQTSLYKEYPKSEKAGPDDVVPSPDRSRFDIPAIIEGLRTIMVNQNEAIGKLANIVESLQLQLQHTQTPPSRQIQKEPQKQQQRQYQQQQRTDSLDLQLSDDPAISETVKKKGKNTRSEKQTLSKPDGVIIKAEKMSYADQLFGTYCTTVS